MKPIHCAIVALCVALATACVPSRPQSSAQSSPAAAPRATEAPDATVAVPSEAPRFGGWRRVRSAYEGQPQHDELLFVMLPEAVTQPIKFAIIDAARGSLRCCLAIDAEPLDAAMLETRFNLPGPWITDLTNGWNESSRFRPTVYRATAVDALAKTGVSLESGQRPGGLLVEAQADLAAHSGGLAVAGVDYRIQTQTDDLPDGDGAIETFRIVRQGQPPHTTLVEVPYGTY